MSRGAHTKQLVITVDFYNGIEMEDNLNKAIEELSSVIKKKGLINMTLEGRDFESLSKKYKVEISDKYPNPSPEPLNKE